MNLTDRDKKIPEKYLKWLIEKQSNNIHSNRNHFIWRKRQINANSKVVLRNYNKTAHRVFTKHSLFGCGYQISLDVLQLQILIQCCKMAQKCISNYVY